MVKTWQAVQGMPDYRGLYVEIASQRLFSVCARILYAR